MLAAYTLGGADPVLVLVAYRRPPALRLLPLAVVAFIAWPCAGTLVLSSVTFSTPPDWPICTDGGCQLGSTDEA